MRDHPPASPGNSPRRVLFASLIGTTIEFFDFYIYATAAVLVFPTLFFPSDDPTSATLQSFATFALAFFARPVGSALFGHFGDRIGRKATLVAALLTMGLSTVAIADRVLVMEHGRIIEDDTPEALISGTGKFSQLHAAWRESLV